MIKFLKKLIGCKEEELQIQINNIQYELNSIKNQVNKAAKKFGINPPDKTIAVGRQGKLF